MNGMDLVYSCCKMDRKLLQSDQSKYDILFGNPAQELRGTVQLVISSQRSVWHMDSGESTAQAAHKSHLFKAVYAKCCWGYNSKTNPNHTLLLIQHPGSVVEESGCYTDLSALPTYHPMKQTTSLTDQQPEILYQERMWPNFTVGIPETYLQSVVEGGDDKTWW